MKRTITAACLVVCCYTSPVSAVEGRDGTFAAIGAGTDSCGRWTADRRNNPAGARQDEQGVLGFIAGMAYEGEGNPLLGLDAMPCGVGSTSSVWPIR
jgi:hypothetical protein